MSRGGWNEEGVEVEVIPCLNNNGFHLMQTSFDPSDKVRVESEILE